MAVPLRVSAAFVGLWMLACSPSGASTEPAQEEPGRAEGAVQTIEAEPSSEEGAAIDSRGASEAAEQFEQGGVLLGLEPDACLLIAERGEQRLVHHFDFPAACHLARDDGGQVRVVETDRGPALMVESSKALDSGCDTALRVVVLTAEGPRLSRAAQRIAMCSPGGGDEMMFHVLASEPVEFGTIAQDP